MQGNEHFLTRILFILNWVLHILIFQTIVETVNISETVEKLYKLNE
jgi:hypothetical protein